MLALLLVLTCVVIPPALLSYSISRRGLRASEYKRHEGFRTQFAFMFHMAGANAEHASICVAQ